MESTELHDMDFISNPFTSFSEPSFFTPSTSSLSDEPDSPKPQNEDEDDYITELTRQMTNYMLQDDEKHQKVPPTFKKKTNSLLIFEILFLFSSIFFLFFFCLIQSRSGGGSGSPQSTLWSPFASGYSSPIGPSREPSPPLTPTVETIMAKVDTKPVTIPFQSKQALIDDQIRSIQANVSSSCSSSFIF